MSTAAICSGRSRPEDGSAVLIFCAGAPRIDGLSVRRVEGSFRHVRCVGATPLKNEHAPRETPCTRYSIDGNESDRQQLKILAAAIIGDSLEFFDYFLSGFVLAFPDRPVEADLPGQSAVVLLSSGVRRHIGAYVWGWLCRPHRPPQGLYRHRAQFLHRNRPAFLPPGQWLVYLAISLRFFRGRRRRPALLAWICHWCRSSWPSSSVAGSRSRDSASSRGRRLGAVMAPWWGR